MRKVYPVSAALVVCAFVFALLSYGVNFALGVLFGGLFGIVNMLLLSRFVTSFLHPGPHDPIEVGVTFLVKFPLAIGILCLVFWRGWVDPAGFLIGFPIIFIVTLTMAISHYYFGSGRRIPEGGTE
jgi:hypothetical protein